MRVIKRGIIPSELLVLATCGYCHSELEFTVAEAKMNTGARNESIYFVECPVCRRTVTQETGKEVRAR